MKGRTSPLKGIVRFGNGSRRLIPPARICSISHKERRLPPATYKDKLTSGVYPSSSTLHNYYYYYYGLSLKWLYNFIIFTVKSFFFLFFFKSSLIIYIQNNNFNSRTFIFFEKKVGRRTWRLFSYNNFTSFPKCLIMIFEIMFSKLTFKKMHIFKQPIQMDPGLGLAQPSPVKKMQRVGIV